MTFTNEMSIERVATGMIDRTLPKPEWTHAAHFAAAIWILRHRPGLASPEAFRLLITRYNEATGTPNTDTEGYHHTITIASLRAAADRLERAGPATPLNIVLADIMASELGGRDWILAHWRPETLFSVAARRDWLEPELMPLPFG